MRPVLIGIAPVRAGEEGQPLSAIRVGSTGHTIAEMAGLSRSEYMQGVDRVNVCASPRRSTVSVSEGRVVAEMLAGSLLRGRRVIMLGPNVAECFGLKRELWDWLQWYEGSTRGWVGFRAGMVPPFYWAVIPHPSGRNRWYNNPENVERASAFLRAELGGAKKLAQGA